MDRGRVTVDGRPAPDGIDVTFSFKPGGLLSPRDRPIRTVNGRATATFTANTVGRIEIGAAVAGGQAVPVMWARERVEGSVRLQPDLRRVRPEADATAW